MIKIIVILMSLFALSPTVVQAEYNLAVKQAQQKLDSLGFQPGPVDGYWGKQTAAAIRSFQRDQGITETGRLDNATREKLGIMLAEKIKNLRTIVINLEGRALLANGIPMMGQFYTSNGSAALGGISADYRNSIVDISSISEKKDPWTPSLGGQVFRTINDEREVSVSLRRRNYKMVYIDADGLVFPNNVRSEMENGAYIDITLLSPEKRTVIPLDDLKVDVFSKTRGFLETERKKHDIVMVKNVPKELLTITVTESKTKRKWEGKLYPLFRGSEPGTIFYWVEKVSVGERRDKDPAYE